MDNKWEEVHLSPMAFAGASPSPQQSYDIKPTTTEPESVRVQRACNLASSGSSRSDLHEHLYTDKISEELRPSAAVWRMYREEAMEHDEELVNGQNQNLDMMLLFAALFSAVLSAFLIESKKLLEQDPADASLKLLLLIAQSQQRIEQGAPRAISPPIELPNFSVSQSARWINGLWFISLGLSLSAALVALLAKEWLAAFTASPPRSAHAYALLRQARLVGLTEWNALPIIDLLPSMLHLSLLLFSFGLMVYLCKLDLVIGVFIALVTGATLLFYLLTAFLGATRRFCPFVTRISKYVRQALNACFKDWMERKGYANIHTEYQSDDTTDEDLRALTWLANNARDPAIVDCVCLSLAGLRLPILNSRTQSISKEGSHLQPNFAPAGLEAISSVNMGIPKTCETSDVLPAQYTLVHGLFDMLYARLPQASVQSPLVLDARQGRKIVQYANGLPQLVQYLETYLDRGLVGKTGLRLMAKNPARAVFEALENVWCNACPSLSPDSYALLTSAELRLITAVAISCHNQRPSLQHTFKTMRPVSFSPPRVSIQSNLIPTQTHIQVSVESTEEPLVSSKVSIFDLRARYSLVLSRAAYLLHFHMDGRAPIGASTLIYLLNTIREAAQQDDLNNAPYLSTHHPRSQTGPAPRIWVQVIGTSDHYSVDPDSIGDEYGLMVGLLRLHASPEARLTAGLEYATGDALNVIARILLKQWLSASSTGGTRSTPATEQFVQAAFANWPRATTAADWQTELVLRIAIIVVPYARHSGTKQLPELAISALYTRLKTDPDRNRAYDTFCSQEHLMNQLVNLVYIHVQYLDQSALQSLMNIFLLDIQNQIYFVWPGVSTTKLPAFLSVLSHIRGRTSELQALLDVLQANVQNYPPYLRLFTSSAEGFSALLAVGGREEYQPMVAKCIVRIIKIATKKDMTIAAEAVPIFFDAVSFTIRTPPSHSNDTEGLPASMCKLLPSLYSFPHDIVHKVAAHPATSIIIYALRSMGELNERPNLLVELEKMQSQLYADNLPLEGLVQLFAQGQGIEDGS